jgi:hypothetical protein
VRLWLLLLAALVGGEAVAQRPVAVTRPEEPIRFDRFSVKPPGRANWFVLESRPEGAMFGRLPPAKPGHTHMAWAIARKLDQPIDDVAAHLAGIRGFLERRFVPDRQVLVESDIQPYARLRAHCVLFRFKATDKGVKGLEGIPQPFLIAGLYCVEPRGRAHSIDLNYSERAGPEQWDAAALAEAEAFFSSLVLADPGEPAK